MRENIISPRLSKMFMSSLKCASFLVPCFCPSDKDNTCLLQIMLVVRQFGHLTCELALSRTWRSRVLDGHLPLSRRCLSDVEVPTPKSDKRGAPHRTWAGRRIFIAQVLDL